MSLEVHKLTKIYGNQKAVNNISFNVNKGEIVGFLGPNGAGKSTTMKMLTCYIEPTAGEAKVCNKSILDDAVAVRRHIGYLPENNPLYLDMYVREYLLFIARMNKVKNAKSRIEEMIELTGLSVEKNKTLGQLSKGYRQRVGLAQALIHNPEVLILDEPTTGLDVNQIQEIREVIKNVGKQKSVLLSTHIMQEVKALCDRVVIINKGEIIADATTAELSQTALNSVQIEVAFKNNIQLSLLQQIKGVSQVITQGKNGFQIKSKATIDVREELFALAVAQNNPIMELSKQSENLESIFKQLTQGN